MNTLKRQKEIVLFDTNKLLFTIDEEVIDSFQFLSMIFGVISFILKFKFALWLSFFFFFANLNEQKMNVPYSKFMVNFGLLVLSFLLLYIFPS